MQLGIFAKTFAGNDALTVLAAARGAGFATAQFNMACLGLTSMPEAITEAQAVSIAAAAAATGVSIAAVSGTYNMIHPDPTVRRTGLARLEVLAASAHAMGTRLITLCTGTRDADDQWRHHADNATPGAWADLVAEMGKAAAIAAAHDVDLGIEPELANVISSAPLARRLLDEIGSLRLKIVLDPANLFEVAVPAERQRLVEQAIDLLAPSIALAHAKDRYADGSFAAAGTGVIDFRHFIASLRAAGVDAPLITHGLEAAQAPSVAKFLAHALEVAA
ncbi:MAG: sugar phosphate isomerase/epimerase [Ancalomicrobiaceae bacterium]|nr:sugar phosphate isomerase/epimerase [Ancalomicrobiaceae bacterium]